MTSAQEKRIAEDQSRAVDREDKDKRIDELIGRAQAARGDGPLVDGIIDQLQDVLGPTPEPSDAFFLAYAWYIHPERSKSAAIQKKVETILSGVVEVVPDHYLSWLYLGHNSYDQGIYSAAHEYFKKATGFAEKTYIGLKSYEMLLCCDMRMRNVSLILHDLRQFVEVAQQCDKNDVWPREFAMELKEANAEDFAPAQFERLLELAAALDTAGNLNRWLSGLVHELMSHSPKDQT
jgi:hypothetical protein